MKSINPKNFSLVRAGITGIVILGFIGPFLFVTPSALAREEEGFELPPPGGGGTNYPGIKNPALTADLGFGDPADVLGRYIGSWLSTAITAAGILFGLYLGWGAAELSISGSDKDRFGNGINKIKNSIIGLAVVSSLFAILKAVGYVLGIDLLESLSLNLNILAP